MPAKLTITTGLSEPFDVEITHTASIGRSKENIVHIRDNPRISRFHALIRCHDGFNYQIADLGSRNGTFVNDKRVVVATPLENNALIRLGDVEILFSRLEESAGSANSVMTMGQSPSCTACVLVCEMVGLDAIAAKIEDTKTAQVFGSWIRVLGHYALSRQGHLDKFLRDGIICYWIEGDSKPTASHLAFEAALEMLAETLRTPNPAEEGAFLSARFALHVGHVSWPSNEFEAGAAIGGEALNSCLSLITAAKELKRSMLLSDSCLATLPDFHLLKLQDIGPLQLKGRKSPVRTFALAD